VKRGAHLCHHYSGVPHGIVLKNRMFLGKQKKPRAGEKPVLKMCKLGAQGLKKIYFVFKFLFKEI
jgi:hypothetical protein